MKIKINDLSKLNLIGFCLSLFFISPVVVFFYQNKGLNYLQILSLESVLVLFIFLSEVPTGILADKIGRKNTIILGCIVNLIGSILFLLSNNYILFIIVFALSGIGIALFSGTIEAYIYDYLKEKQIENQMKKYIGLYYSYCTIGSVIASIIGSIICKNLEEISFIYALSITVIGSIIALIISITLKNKKKLKDKEDEDLNSFRMLLEGFKLIKTNKHLLYIILLNIFASPFVYCLSYLYQPYLKLSGVSIIFFGIISAVASFVSLIANKYVYKLEKLLGDKLTLFISVFLPSLFYIFMSIVFHQILSVFLYILLRGIIGLQEPVFSDYKNKQIPSKIRATVLSLISMLGSLYQIFMRLFIGKLADINISYSFILIASLIIITCFILFTFFRKKF